MRQSSKRDNPDLRGKPVVVSGSAERGVVAAASCMKLGSSAYAPPCRRSLRSGYVRGLIFVEPRFDAYKAISLQIRNIFAEHTLIIEPLSLDEAYLDVTENLQGIPLARDVALRIREKIKAETSLNASAGISSNKFLAKLASDHRKPNGQYVISPRHGTFFRGDTPCREIPRDRSCHSRQVQRTRHPYWLRYSQSVSCLSAGATLARRALTIIGFREASTRGQSAPIALESPSVRKIRSPPTSSDFDALGGELQPLIDKVLRYCETTGNRGRTVTLKVKFADFEIITRSRSLPYPIASRDDLERLAVSLLQAEMPLPKRVRLLGLSLSSLQTESKAEPQMALPI